MSEPPSNESLASGVGPGWRTLVMPLIERCQADGVPIYQIKQKFGSLRFYVGGGSASLEDAICEAEKKSTHLCEDCGAPGRLRDLDGRYRTCCDTHAVVR